MRTIHLSAVLVMLVSCCSGKESGDGGLDLDDMDEGAWEDMDLHDEDLDPHDEDPGDGTEDDASAPSCLDDRDCADDNPCNGIETCDPGNLRCTSSPAPVDGTLCGFEPRSICLSGFCVVSECGDGFVDTGALEFCEPPGEGRCYENCGMFCDRYTVDCEDDGNFCNGEEYCYMEVRECRRRNAPEPFTACRPTPGMICIENTCVESFCGDGIVDTGRGEFCEPPGEDDCDSNCILSCSLDSDCGNDDDPCNGQEFCDQDAGRCSRRNPAPLGTVCGIDPRLICIDGLCLESRCGDGYVDSEGGEYCEPPGIEACGMDCQVPCASDEACSDGEFCNGEERCDDWMALCEHVNPPTAGTFCDDGIPSNDPDICDGTSECIGIGGCEISGVTMIDAGESHTCVLLGSGEVRCWGSNSSGQLGDGTNVDSMLPTLVSGLPSGVQAVSAGRGHSCALLSTGEIRCWGRNEYGQLGNGTTAQSPLPVTVSGLDARAVAVATGLFYTCALLDTGDVQCWGSNSRGQLGDGTTIGSLLPVTVAGLSSRAVALNTGGEHTCVLLDTGGMQCWGAGGRGQLGDGTTSNRLLPVTVRGLAASAAGITTGSVHTCALLDSHALQCWGANNFGQVGDGTFEDRISPVTVEGFSSPVAMARAGHDHSCAVLAAGEVQCWGKNNHGQLGIGNGSDHASPVAVVGLSSSATAVTGGLDHSCALLLGGRVECWGGNILGQLGYPTASEILWPTRVSGLASRASIVAAGWEHTCAVLDTGVAQCWGMNDYGQLGNGTTMHQPAPVSVSGLSTGTLGIALGGGFYEGHTCALLEGGQVRCWGTNNYGQVGDGTTTDRSLPITVSGLLTGASAVAAGIVYSCALLETGGAMCWGSNAFGQLGDWTETDRWTPVEVLGLDSSATAIATGGEHTCALLDTGGMQCWGYGGRGQLGDGRETTSSIPVTVLELPSSVIGITTGWVHTCALLDSREIQCWGANSHGQLGDGTRDDKAAPVAVSGILSDAAVVEAGLQHTCVLLDTGGVQCWGLNNDGQLGIGTTGDRSAPMTVAGLPSRVISLSGGEGHTCAALDTGDVYCWGRNAYGQVTGAYPGLANPVLCGH